MKQIGILLIILVMTGTTTLSQSWKEKEPIPTKRWCPAIIAIGEDIYVIGGQTEDGSSSALVEVYHSTTDTWSVKASMNYDRWAPMAAPVKGEIYVFGGMQGIFRDNGYREVDYSEVYNPLTDKWTIKTPKPTPRGWGGCEVVPSIENTIFVMGGFSMSGYKSFDTVEIYSVENDSWTAGPSMPLERDCFMSTHIENIIYIIGGYIGPAPTNTVLAFDPFEGSYTELEPLPEVKALGSATNDGDKVYVVGGREGNSGEFYSFDPVNNIWKNHTDMPTGREGLVSTLIHGNLYAIAGSLPGVSGMFSNKNEVVDMHSFVNKQQKKSDSF